MKFTKIMTTMLCSLLLFCGCAKNSDVVLKINDSEITRGEFYNDLKKIMSVHSKNLPKEFQKEDSFAMLSVKFSARANPFGPTFLLYSPIIILLFKYTPVAMITAFA